jgi:hypothetical protein
MIYEFGVQRQGRALAVKGKSYSALETHSNHLNRTFTARIKIRLGFEIGPHTAQNIGRKPGLRIQHKADSDVRVPIRDVVQPGGYPPVILRVECEVSAFHNESPAGIEIVPDVRYDMLAYFGLLLKGTGRVGESGTQ